MSRHNKMENTDTGKAILKEYADIGNVLSINKLADKHNVNQFTVRNMIKRNTPAIQELKSQHTKAYKDQDMVKHLRNLSQDAVLACHAKLDSASAKDQMIIAGIALDKSYLVESNGVININVVHDHRHELDNVGDLLMAQLQSRGQLKQTNAIDVEFKELS